MKQFFRVNILTGILLFLCISAWSQVPFEINYQGIARDLNGTLLSGQEMRVRITLYDQNPSGTTIYSETKKVTTNKWGLFTLGIGNDAGLITRTGKLSSVDWSVNAKFIGVEIDPNGSNQFIQLGTTQLLSVPYSLYSLKSKDGLPPIEGQSHKVLTNDGNQAFWDTIIIPKYQSGDGITIKGNTIEVTKEALLNATRIHNIPIDISSLQNGGILCWDEKNNQIVFDKKRLPGDGLRLEENTLHIQDTSIFNASKIMDVPVDMQNKQDGFVLAWDKESNSFKLIPRLIAQEGLAFDGNNLSIRDTAIFNASKILDVPVDIQNKQDGFVLAWDKTSNSFKLIPRLIAQEGLAFDGNNLSIRDTAVFNAARIMDIPVDTLNKEEGFVLAWDKASNSFKLIPRLIAQEGLAFDGNNLSIRDTAVFNAARILDIPVDTLNKQEGFVLAWDKASNSFKLIPRLIAQEGLAFDGNNLSIRDTAVFNAARIMDIPVDTLHKEEGYVLAWDKTSNSFKLIPRLIALEGLAFDGKNLSIRDTAVFNAARIMGLNVDTAALANGAVLNWNSSERKLQFTPQISAGTGLVLTNQTLHIKDEPIFNAGKIANYAVDSNGKTDGNVIFWDSASSQYKHRSVDSLFDGSQILTQEGNSFGTEVVIGTQDSFGIDFKINNQVMAHLKKTGEFNVDYFKPNKQFIAPAKFHPLDPVRLYNGDTSYNGEWLPPFAFEEDPKTGIALEDMEATAMTLVNKGRPLLRTYWEDGIADNAAILHGFGRNRLTIQSESNMVFIAKRGRFEWESFTGNYLDFVGYTAASHQGKTIRFTTEPLDPATPIAIMPFGNVNALEILEGGGNINSVFDHDGWLGINTDRPMAPLHIRNKRTSANTTLAILENNLGEEVFTAANDRTSFFGGKAFYRTAPLLNEEDSNALVNKKYVDDRMTLLHDHTSVDSNEIHTLIDPEITLDSYTLSFPTNPRNGMECYFYFGGKIMAGTVVRTLQFAEGVNNVLMSSSLPENIPAGEVIGFRWFESSSKWYRKD